MEQLVEIAYELIAFRTTFKGELFRHGMGIGKIKLVEGKQLIHILAFTIEKGVVDMFSRARVGGQNIRQGAPWLCVSSLPQIATEIS